ncbi:unnamed protein product [Linum trigynum]|uniref:Uncharacterized protein n=1 Tax=Linum trigynum TaxID=586398 RepID=A0AAV2EJ53_9ROSI
MGKGAKQSSRVKKMLKFPVKLLVKARDFYVTGMSQLSDHMRYDAVATMGCPTPYTAGLPRSYSVGGGGSTNSRSDYSELIRTASLRSNNRSVSQKQGVISSGMIKVSGEAGKVSRSYSVGLGRIDEEEKSGEFGEDRAASSDAFRRSRSCAVSATGGVLARTATAGKFRQQL